MSIQSVCSPRSALLALACSFVSLGCGGSGGGNETAPDTVGSTFVVVRPSTVGQDGVSHYSTADSTGSTTFVNGPGVPPLGFGSLELAVGPNGDGGEEMRFTTLDGQPLTEITSLEYWTYIQSGSGLQAPYLVMRIDWNGDNVQDDLIFFEPEYQHGYTALVPDQGDLVVGAWQSWDARQGGWWSNTDSPNAGADVRPLATYAAAHPGARVIAGSDASGGLRIIVGYGAPPWTNFVGNVDALTVGLSGVATAYDFEP